MDEAHVRRCAVAVGMDPENQDPVTRDKRLPLTGSCQIRLPGTPEGKPWKPIEMLMYIP